MTTQINELSKDAAKMAFKQGETVNSIESNINSTKIHMDKAVGEITEANQINQSSSGMLDKVFYIILFVVLMLVLLSWIMPS